MVKHLLYFAVISLFFIGCATSTSQNNSYNKRPATNRVYAENKQQNEKVSKDRVGLSILATPKDAKIRILNIKPKYRDNIFLKRGKYLIEVSKKGYKTYKKWINLQSNKNLHVNLKKREESKFAYNGIVSWRENRVEDRFKKYSTYTLMDSLKISVANNKVWLDSKFSKAHNVKWDLANRYCNNLKLYNLKWRLPNCKEANYYYNKIRKYFRNYPYSAPWTNKKNIKAQGYKQICKYYDGDPYYMQLECVASKPKIKNDSIFNIALSILKDYKNISKQKALQEALNIKFGNPKIKDISYSSKDEMLSFSLVSSRVKDFAPSKIKFKLKNALTSKNSQRVREHIRVYNFKNESVIIYDPPFYISKYKAFKFDKIENFKNLVFKDYIFDDSLKYASFPIKLQKERVYIFVDKIETDTYEMGDFLVLSDTGDNIRSRGKETLYIDPKIEINVKNIRKYFFKERVKLKVSPKYAKEMISLISSKNFKPTVLFEIKENKLIFKGVKELKFGESFVEKEEFKRVYYDIGGLRNFIKKFPHSPYVKEAQKRINEIRKLYKGYEPFGIFKVDGCVGYFPYNLITKIISKLKIDPISIQPNIFKEITWHSLCRRGLLSGRGNMKMVSKDRNLIIEINGKMRDGFFIGDVTRVNKKVTRRVSKATYYFKSDTLKESIKLDNFSDYKNYQEVSK
jgi:hypothetical protein